MQNLISARGQTQRDRDLSGLYYLCGRTIFRTTHNKSHGCLYQTAGSCYLWVLFLHNNNSVQVPSRPHMNPLVSLITRSINGMCKQYTRVSSVKVGYTATLPFFFFGLGR